MNSISLNSLTDNAYFMESYKTDVKIEGSKQFAEFLSCFQKVDYPSDISYTQIKKYQEEYLSKRKMILKKGTASQKTFRTYIPEVGLGQFSRLGPPKVQPLARFYIDDKTIAVTYLLHRQFDNSSFSIHMVTYDLCGKPKNVVEDLRPLKFESVLIARSSPTETMLCEFKNQKELVVTTYSNVWEKDISEAGLLNNSIIYMNKKKMERITITKSGTYKKETINPSFAGLFK